MQDNKLLRVEGAVENIVFRNDENGYTVLELADGGYAACQRGR